MAWFKSILIFGLILCFMAMGDDAVPLPVKASPQTAQKADVITIAATGDLMLGGRVLPFLRDKGADYPFDSTRAIFCAADIAMANLEAPFTTRDLAAFEKKYTFRVPPGYGSGLKRAGFDLVSLANNHILDYGLDGLTDTKSLLDSLEVAHCGAGQNRQAAELGVILERHGRRIAFLAYSMTYPDEFWATDSRAGTAFPSEDRLESRIRSVKDSADWVVVSFHWGGERMTHPKPYQRRFARLAVDAGADLIIGHHPHVLQGVELYNGALIAYSLGNYAFGSYNRSCRESAILRVRFDESGLIFAEMIPINVNNYEVHFQPRILNGTERNRVIVHLNQISRPLNHESDVMTTAGAIILH